MLHPVIEGALRQQGLPVANKDDSRNMLLRELATFLEDAGNVLCDDCHDIMSRKADELLRRVLREMGQ